MKMTGKLFLEGSERAGNGVDDETADTHVMSHKWMVAHKVYGLGHRAGRVVESVKPAVEVYAAVTHQGDVFFINSPRTHRREHVV